MIAKYLAYIADFSILIPIVIAIAKNVKFNSNTYRFIGVYGALILARNAITLIMNQLGIYNIYIYNWCSLLGFVTLAIIYSFAIKNDYFKFFAILCVLIVIGTSFIDSDTLFNTKTEDFNEFSYVSEGLAIIFILFYFYQLLQSLHVPNLTRYSLFWFSTGVLFYYTGTIFSYLFIESTFNNTIELRQKYWMIDASLSTIFNIFLALTVWYMKPAKTAE